MRMLTAAMEVSRRDWNARLVELQAESDRELLCYAGLTWDLWCWQL